MEDEAAHRLKGIPFFGANHQNGLPSSGPEIREGQDALRQQFDPVGIGRDSLVAGNKIKRNIDGCDFLG
jgi:hypothetical protein